MPLAVILIVPWLQASSGKEPKLHFVHAFRSFLFNLALFVVYLGSLVLALRNIIIVISDALFGYFLTTLSSG